MAGLLIATMFVLVVETALATFVATRAWDDRPARLFPLVAAGLAALNILVPVRAAASDPAAIYWATVVATLSVGGLQLVLLLFFSALFAPQWWQGARPIRWIALPYVLALAILAIDLAGGLGLIADGLIQVGGAHRLKPAQPGAAILLGLFVAGWLVELALLAVAFARDRGARPALGLLFLAIVISSALGLLAGRVVGLGQLGGLLQTLMVIGALAYAVLRTRLFEPTRAALDLAIQAMSESVVVLDQDDVVAYANPQAAALGLRPGLPAEVALREAGAEPYALANLLDQAHRAKRGTLHPLALGGRRIEFSAARVADRSGRAAGTLLLGRDVTEIAARSEQLEQERARLAETVRELEAGQRERAVLSATIQGLSLPLIPVVKGVLVLPLVGSFDSRRIAELTDVLLKGIERERARLVLIDITGIPLLDEAGAAGLLRAVRAAGLLGARCVLVGIRPEIADALVALGVPLNGLATASTLQQALGSELRLHS